MYLIYSALQNQASPDSNERNVQEKQLRYEAYRAVCEKYRHEIAAIQKYLPNWKPRFEQ
ncbi:hypothetical protein [Mucilaginibacter auburnensis]|uniref:Uncharacterized protein n=1 Tax=Mucilaginibacter auburnensis TaxID=1457233 RepID=A0A2H9VNS1_9SPHI|nr:hypothetical protein [Mucilaginibacter auburnensis]PJJ79952.1 hypothetical protein CLV57_3091 [Mucilaginibacter auburnensis]